jgi:hypothetical protein
MKMFLGVGIEMGYRLDTPASIPSGANFSLLHSIPDRFWGPPNLLSNEYWGACEADLSALSSAEVKKG